MSFRGLVKIILFVFIALVNVGSVSSQNSIYVNSSAQAFDESYELYKACKYNACIDSYEKFRLKYPNDKPELCQFYIAASHLYLFHDNAEYELGKLAEQNQGHFVSSLAFYELGVHFYREGDYDKTIQYLTQVKKEQLGSNDRGELNFKLGYAYFSKKQFKKALDLFGRAKLRNSKYHSASAYYSGYIYIHLKQWKKALDVLKPLEKDPAYALHVPAMIAKAMYNLGMQEELLKYGHDILESGKRIKRAEQVSLFVGAVYFDQKDYMHATEFISVYKRKAKKPHRDVYYRLGFSYFKEGKYYDAIDNLKNSMIPDDSLAQVTAYYLGHSYLKTKQIPYAITAFKQAFDLTFNKSIEEEALLNYGKLSYQNGNNGNTIIGLTRLLNRYPDTKNGNLVKELLSDAYLKSDNYEDAVNYLGSIRKKTEKVKYAYQNAAFMLAVKYYNCKDFAQTEAYLDKAFTYPSNKDLLASSYYLKAEMLAQQEKYNLAILNYSGVFQTDSKRSSVYYLKSRYGIAFAYYNHKEYTKAKAHYEYYVNKAKTKDTYYADAMIHLADCYYIGEDYGKASKYYESALEESNYMNDYALYQSGVMAFIMKDYDKSKARFREMSAKYPNSGYADNALFQSAMVDMDIAKYDIAVVDFTKLIETYPGSDLLPIALEKRGLAYVNLRNFRGAKKDFVQIIEQFSTNEVAKGAILSLQAALTELGEQEDLPKYLAAYKLANPDDKNIEKVEYESAKGLYSSEKYRSGVAAFESFMNLHPNSPLINKARYYLAECYRLNNDNAKALRTFEIFIKDNKGFFMEKSISKCANLYYLVDSFTQARVKYKLLSDASTKNKYKVKGYLGQMKSAYAMEDFKSSLKHANYVINKSNAHTKDINLAYLYKSKNEFLLGNDSNGVTSLKYLLTNSKYESGAEANYLLAKYYYDQKDYNQSIEVLRQLNDNYASYDYWLGKSFLLIADNYIALNELFQAKATLVSLKEKSSSKQIVEEAELKLQFLNQQGMQQAAPDSDSTGVNEIIPEEEVAPDSLNNNENKNVPEDE